MSIPNAIRDNNEGYFLEEDIDIAAWISKVAADIPHTTFMYQLKVVFGSPLNFETVFSGFQSDSLTLNHQSTRWITDCSTPLRVGSQITKGPKEQIYMQIIPYMQRYEEKRPYSAAGMERAAYMQLHQCPPAPNKGKQPVTGSLQSRLSAHALQSAKTGESSQQHLDMDLDSYYQAREPVLPYEEEPPSGVHDVEMNAPVVAGANSTLPDESTMNIDHELDDLYE
ncbi:hypothetical protein M422DRAFT_243528 [Sphaerobolus stellatus SS14]|nr:hypothetical protein M422DRAFT_243528 [Sphaerobolus stellatus SS14]